MRLSRRAMLGLGAATLLPRPAFAASGDRKFLFVFCPGGWDPTYVFAPLFDRPLIDMEADAVEAEENGIRFVDADSRPSVRAFFEDWGDRAVVVNGFESRSVAHDVCRRLTMTGSSLPDADDWAAILAHHAADAPLLPFIHISGPSYAHDFGAATVRVGDKGQFLGLLDGSALSGASPPLSAPPESVTALEDAYALARAEAFAGAASRGRRKVIGDLAVATESDLAGIVAMADSLELGGGSLEGSLDSLVSCFSDQLARCAMVAYNGYNDYGWDTHSSNDVQGLHYEELFAALNTTLARLQKERGDRGSLLDDVTVVVLSEMGRYPQLNAAGGKEHWTFTSALLVGGGLRGGQVVGGYDDEAGGRPVDLASGAPHDSGVELLPGHIGATLLALAGVDPAEYVDEEPIEAVLA